jgi:hypothetical protein
MFLNSPFLDLNVPPLAKRILGPAASGLGRFRPRADLRLGLNEVYGRSIHRDHGGEWQYDLTWKPLGCRRWPGSARPGPRRPPGPAR